MKIISRFALASTLLLAAFFISIEIVFTEFYFWIFNLDTTALSFLKGDLTAEELRAAPIQGFQFTSKEVAHFIDIKSLLNTLGWIIPIPVCIAIILLINAPKSTPKISALTIKIQSGLFLTFTLIYTLGYWKEFTRFIHPLFFPDGNWQFHPQSLIIKLYPKEIMQMGLAAIMLITLAQTITFYVLTKRFKKIY